MRNTLLVPFMAGLLGACLIVGWGCARTPNPTFYTLDSLVEAGAGTSGAQAPGGIALGVGPIELPDYLDRPQIVTRVSPNEVRLSEFHRWAGPIADSVPEILAQNLSILLGTDRVARYPWNDTTPIDCRVEIKIFRFDGKPGEDVFLRSQWTLFTPDRKKVLAAKSSTLREPTNGTGYDALVSAESRALEALSRQIADAVAGLPGDAGRE